MLRQAAVIRTCLYAGLLARFDNPSTPGASSFVRRHVADSEFRHPTECLSVVDR